MRHRTARRMGGLLHWQLRRRQPPRTPAGEAGRYGVRLVAATRAGTICAARTVMIHAAWVARIPSSAGRYSGGPRGFSGRYADNDRDGA